MAAVNVTSVNILNNPSSFDQPLQFEIQYECNTSLQHDLEWRITYVGSADSEEFDQVLDSVLVGPVGPGQYKFVLQTDAPDLTKLPSDDVVGVTVILLTCLYQDKEFLRIGYYVNNDYFDEETRENPPEMPDIQRLVRSILADKPRVTRFPIEWDASEAVPTVGGAPPPAQLQSNDVALKLAAQQAAAAAAGGQPFHFSQMDGALQHAGPADGGGFMEE